MTEQPTQSLEFIETVRELIEALDESRGRYAIVGAIAVTLHGIPRLTNDVDVIFSIEKIGLPEFLSSLRHRGFEFDQAKTLNDLQRDYLAQVVRQGVIGDLMMPPLPFHHELLQRARKLPVYGHLAPVCTPEDLVVLKLVANVVILGVDEGLGEPEIAAAVERLVDGKPAGDVKEEIRKKGHGKGAGKGR